MAHPKTTSNDEFAMDNDSLPVPKRIIKQCIATKEINDKLITELSIGFKKSKFEKVNEIPKKHRELLKQIQAIDSTAYFESNTQIIEDSTDIPNGTEYNELFGEKEEIFRGHVYVGCKLHSKIPLIQIKWSPNFVILEWLKKGNIHVDEKSY